MNPTATKVHKPPNSGGRLKGAIGITMRVHYLWQMKTGTSVGTSACRGAVGEFAIVGDDAWVTCPKCRQLERDRTVPKTIDIGP